MTRLATEKNLKNRANLRPAAAGDAVHPSGDAPNDAEMTYLLLPEGKSR